VALQPLQERLIWLWLQADTLLADETPTGHLPIDNNPCEQVIQPIALARKNFLFVGTERAGKRAAAIQSLLVTAKLNGLDPSAWLKDTLEKLPTWPNSRIDELLPFANYPIAIVKSSQYKISTSNAYTLVGFGNEKTEGRRAFCGVPFQGIVRHRYCYSSLAPFPFSPEQ
jgi:hypothetical protein